MQNTSSQPKRPRPGLGIIVLKDKKEILLGKRKDCSLYGIPGGYLEKYESWEEGAARELKEETDLSIDLDKIHVIQVFNAVNKDRNYHNVAIVLVCEYPEGQEVKLCEPHKCEGWAWWNIDDLEKRFDELFWPNKQLVEEFKDKMTAKYLTSVLENPPVIKSSFFNYA
jgi:8-oxo-dGTP diphosphatase